MAVDASGTRAKLIAAGEWAFAIDGIHGAQMREIVRRAGQANDSAVHYHFGSRQGLLSAICERHIAEMEPDRERRLAAQPADPELALVVTDLLRPTADRLRSPAGRYFLRITAQLAGLAGVRTGSVPPRVMGAALATQLDQVRAACAHRMPPELAEERIAVLVGATTTALAERAVAIDAGLPFTVDEETFLANLEAMMVAALLAPVPASEPALVR